MKAYCENTVVVIKQKSLNLVEINHIKCNLSYCFANIVNLQQLNWIKILCFEVNFDIVFLDSNFHQWSSPRSRRSSAFSTAAAEAITTHHSCHGTPSHYDKPSYEFSSLDVAGFDGRGGVPRWHLLDVQQVPAEVPLSKLLRYVDYIWTCTRNYYYVHLCKCYIGDLELFRLYMDIVLLNFLAYV